MKPTSCKSVLSIILLAANAISLTSAADATATTPINSGDHKFQIIDPITRRFLKNPTVGEDQTLICAILPKKDVEAAIAAQERAEKDVAAVDATVARASSSASTSSGLSAPSQASDQNTTSPSQQITPVDPPSSTSAGLIVEPVANPGSNVKASSDNASTGAGGSDSTITDAKPKTSSSSGTIVADADTNAKASVVNASTGSSIASGGTSDTSVAPSLNPNETIVPASQNVTGNSASTPPPDNGSSSTPPPDNGSSSTAAAIPEVNKGTQSTSSDTLTAARVDPSSGSTLTVGSAALGSTTDSTTVGSTEVAGSSTPKIVADSVAGSKATGQTDPAALTDVSAVELKKAVDATVTIGSGPLSVAVNTFENILNK